jgi:hypothetical protein
MISSIVARYFKKNFYGFCPFKFKETLFGVLQNFRVAFLEGISCHNSKANFYLFSKSWFANSRVGAGAGAASKFSPRVGAGSSSTLVPTSTHSTVLTCFLFLVYFCFFFIAKGETMEAKRFFCQHFLTLSKNWNINAHQKAEVGKVEMLLFTLAIF